MSLMSAKKLLMAGKRYKLEEVQSLPPMTSNFDPDGYAATASDILSLSNNAWKAFDQKDESQDRSSYWRSHAQSDGYQFPHWLQRQVPTPIKIWKYRIRGSKGPVVSNPYDFDFQVSNNGNDFVTIDSRRKVVFTSSGEVYDFKLGKVSESWVYFRLNILANQPSAGTRDAAVVQELELLQAK